MSVRFFPKDTVQVKLYGNMTMYHYSNLKKLFFLKNNDPEMLFLFHSLNGLCFRQKKNLSSIY